MAIRGLAREFSLISWVVSPKPIRTPAWQRISSSLAMMSGLDSSTDGLSVAFKPRSEASTNTQGEVASTQQILIV